MHLAVKQMWAGRQILRQGMISEHRFLSLLARECVGFGGAGLFRRKCQELRAYQASYTTSCTT